MIFKKILLFSLFVLMVLFILGFGDRAEAQPIPGYGCDFDTICEPGLAPGGNGEDIVSCPSDCAVGLCETCVVTPDCDTGLTCIDGKCRGCPCSPGEICFCNPLKACAFTELSDSIINFVFYFAVVFAPLMFLIAGFHFITAAGDSKKISTGKTIVKWTLVGLFVILLAKGIIGIINALLGTS